MNLVKKLTIGAATISLAAGSFITPAFAATASNTNVSGGSIAKSKAVEVKKQRTRVKNENTTVVVVDVSISNNGLNSQSHNEDKNVLKTGDAISGGVNSATVNYTSIQF